MYNLHFTKVNNCNFGGKFIKILFYFEKFASSETVVSSFSAISMSVSSEGFENATSILPIKLRDKPNLSASSC